MFPRPTVILILTSSFLLADGWFFGMLGCQNRCQTYTGFYQSRNPNLHQMHYAVPTPPANSYATAPSSYVAPGNAYPVAAQYAIPMNSYAMPQYAVAPSYVVPYPTPPAYVRPPPVYVTPPPVYVTPPPTTTTTTTTTTIPPPRCFQNTNGYKCCNRMLDQFLDMKVSQMQRPEWQRCNLQRFATQLQLEAQAMFNHSMESIIASGEMQNLARYRGDLYCKKRSLDGKIVVVYGSATPYSLESGVTRPMTEDELRMANYPAKYDEIGVHDGREDNIW